MINFKKYLAISLVIIIYSGCSTKEQFHEGMYEGFKTRERMINPEYNDKINSNKEKNIDYKEYNSTFAPKKSINSMATYMN